MSNASRFSKSYSEARARFLAAAKANQAELYSYPLATDDGEELFMDVAAIGSKDAPALVISSGVHGVEGFFGSAVQLAQLERLRDRQRLEVRYVLIHAINPFGFARLRRFNEGNVDLNRNFLTVDESYEGSPDGYARLDTFLNPKSPPTRLEPFRLKAMWKILRYGLESLKQCVAGGQYDYPDGIFYGGNGPSPSMCIVRDNCAAWLGESDAVAHIDMHTGLGPFGTYKLLLAETAESPNYDWYLAAFGAENVEPFDNTQSESTAYKVTGLFGGWLQRRFASRKYRFATAEFGTYDVIRVLGAIRAESRAHHYGVANSDVCQAAKAELLECFCPADDRWRTRVLETGLSIIDQAEDALRSL